MTHSRQSMNGELPGSEFFSRTVISAINDSAGSIVLKTQGIENVYLTAGRKITISFYARSNMNHSIGVAIHQHIGTSVSHFIELMFDVTTEWKRYEATVDMPSVAGKTVEANHRLQWYFRFSEGTIYPRPQLHNQVGTFDIAQVKLEVGDRATPFVPRLPGEELALCQRHYEIGTHQADARPSVIFMDTISYKANKRISTPTVSILSGFYGAPNSVDVMYNSQWYNIPVTGVASRGSEFTIQTAIMPSALEYYSSVYFTWKSDAE